MLQHRAAKSQNWRSLIRVPSIQKQSKYVEKTPPKDMQACKFYSNKQIFKYYEILPASLGAQD